MVITHVHRGQSALVLCLAFAAAIVAVPGRARADGADAWLARDKINHFSITLALGIEGYEVGALLSPNPAVRAASGAAFSLSAGVAKEILDRRSGGDVSARDLAWDALGAAVGAGIGWLFDHYAFGPLTGRAPASGQESF